MKNIATALLTVLALSSFAQAQEGAAAAPAKLTKVQNTQVKKACKGKKGTEKDACVKAETEKLAK